MRMQQEHTRGDRMKWQLRRLRKNKKAEEVKTTAGAKEIKGRKEVKNTAEAMTIMHRRHYRMPARGIQPCPAARIRISANAP